MTLKQSDLKEALFSNNGSVNNGSVNKGSVDNGSVNNGSVSDWLSKWKTIWYHHITMSNEIIVLFWRTSMHKV